MDSSFNAVRMPAPAVVNGLRLTQALRSSLDNTIPRFILILSAALLLGLMPWSAAYSATTTGVAATGAALWTSKSCSVCHGATPSTIYASTLNAANAGTLVTYMNTTHAMGVALAGTDANDLAAHIAGFVTIPTTISTAYNTASAATATGITFTASVTYGGDINAIASPGTDVGNITATKGAVSFSTGAAPFSPTLTYTPTTGACGTDTFTYEGSGAGGTTSLRTVSVTIGNPAVPTVTSANTASGIFGTNATQYTVTASSTQNASLCGATTFSATGLPTGLSINTSSGAISGTPTAAGTFNTTVYAANPGGTSTGLAVTFTIAKASQTVSVPTVPAVTVGASTAAATATASSGLSITWSASGGGCSVAANGVVTGLVAGTNNCTITATQAGDANHLTASNSLTVSVGKGTQTVTVSVPAVSVNTTAQASATITNALGAATGLTVTTWGAAGGCTISATGLVTGTAGGTANCTVTATQAGDTNYNLATGSSSINVGKGTQTLSWTTTPPASLFVNATTTLAATSTAGLAITYGATGACSIAGAVVTAAATIGTCTVTASQATGDANYNPATPLSSNISIGLTPQTIGVISLTPMTFGGATGTLSATATSGLPVSFGSTTTGVCTVAGTTVTAVSAGTCTIQANQAGDATFGAALTVTQNFTIAKANQTITFGTAPAVVVNGTGTASASSTSALAVTYSVPTTTTICSVNAGTGVVTGIAAGTCTIAANQAGNGNYNAATQVTLNITVGQGSQSITFGAAPTVVAGGTGTVSGAVASGLTISYSSITPTTCSITGTTVSGLATGVCTIAANQAGNANYTAAPQVTQNITIGVGSQTLTFGAVPTVVVGGTGTVSATATSGLAVTYSSTTAGVCTVSGSTVTGVGVGTCTIAANQAGNANYTAAAQVTQNIVIGIGSQTISFAAAPAIAVGGTGTVSATATSGLAVAYSTASATCSVNASSGLVTGLSAGTCTVAANQAGNANYSAAAQMTQNVTISNLPPSVTAASMTTTLNTAATLDLAASITGTGVTGINVSTAALHGTTAVSGTKVTYTPAKDYFGTDTFSFVAYGTVGVSPTAATVTVTITGRPDPLQDARVTGLVNIQTAAVKRFGRAQIFNFQQRLESRHHAVYNNVASPVTAPDVPSGTPAPAGDAQSGQGRGYFNSWQPGTAVAYTNDPNTLLHAPDRLSDAPGAASDPMSMMLANVVKGALTSSSLNLATVSNAAGAMQEDSFSRLEVWAAGNLRFGTRSQAGVDTVFSTDGISVGVDKRLDRKLTVGMGMGYARDKSSIGTDGTNSTSSGNSVAGYASYQMDSGSFIDALLGYGKVSFDTKRYVASVNDFARATRKGDQIFGSFSFGYEYRKEGLLWSPYGRYDVSFDRLDAGTETGAGANALSYASQSSRNSQIALGLRAQSVHQASFGIVQPRARIEYQRGIENSGQTSIAYADLLGTQYTLAATTLNTNSIVAGLGSDFLLSDTLKLALDYQRLRSLGRENYQSINFRLTKELEGKNDFEALLTESYSSSISHPTGLMVAAGYAFEDNASRASEPSDKLSDIIYSLTVSKAKSIVMSPHTKLTLSGFLDMEKFHTYTGLGHVSGGGQAEYLYRASGEFGSPTYGIFARFTADNYESTLRDGSRRSAGVTLRKPVTDRIHLFGALADNVRTGRSDVFNTHDVSVRTNLDYALAADKTIYLTGEYRKGDIISSGRPSLKILDIATVFVHDDAFDALGFHAYRMKGKTSVLTLGYNLAFGAKDSIDLSYRWVHSVPDKTPSFPTTSTSYTDKQLSISYLMAF